MVGEEYIFGSNYHNNEKWMHSQWLKGYVSHVGWLSKLESTVIRYMSKH